MKLSDGLVHDYPVIQAAMGGGISTPELVCAVSKAGGLGSLGHSSPASFSENLNTIKSELGSRPYSANILLPLATSSHINACIKQRVPVVSIFYGYRKGLISSLKNAGITVAYQVGSEAEAATVVREGADILIVQGYQAGGHLRGLTPLLTLLPTIRARFPEIILFAAGGIHNPKSASVAISAGADGVAAGTRFLMSSESGAHPLYKNKLLEGNQTVATSLFGFGWCAPHRVLVNSATEKWLANSGEVPRWTKPINKGAALFARHMPQGLQNIFYRAQTLNMPIYTPIAPNKAMTGTPQIETSALYAGTCVSEISTIEPAANIVKQLGESLI